MTRASWYALRTGGWRDYVTLLHVPYTLWHLSYVVIGAAIAPIWLRAGSAGRSRPSRSRSASVRTRWTSFAAGHSRPVSPMSCSGDSPPVSIGLAIGIGVAAAIAWWPWLAAFVAFGGFIVVAYNLELFGGAFHSDLWFAIAWGSFPLLTAFAAAAETVTLAAVAAAVFAALLSLAQRRLSTPVRMVRRHVRKVSGTLDLDDGEALPVTPELFSAARRRLSGVLTAATIALAVALVLLRV